ncbi:MAG: 50S ribosomal protein L21 [Candidatus Kerfeldbacteria bacterium]|jgi:large subunit ribosomal protein L21
MKIAVIATGGKQYLVKEGDTLKVEKLNKKKDAEVTFSKVLLYSDGKKTEVGQPSVKGVKVTGKVLEEARSRKVMVVKYKSKIRYKRTLGHRQHFTKIKIEKIVVGK